VTSIEKLQKYLGSSLCKAFFTRFTALFKEEKNVNTLCRMEGNSHGPNRANPYSASWTALLYGW
jgi:hypothetical protein